MSRSVARRLLGKVLELFGLCAVDSSCSIWPDGPKG